MGRPLKIAKAQAILTLTATDGTAEEVTVSQTLATYGVIAGMPFTVATTTGGLTAGTTYWILSVTGASTFTVSATPLNANPTYTPVNLSTAGPVTVTLTVGAVDTGFNNPAGSSNTYSVVGGNTNIYGKQVLVGVAIGIAGTGTIGTESGNANIFGGGTDFANDLSVGSAVQIVNSNGSVTDLGFVTTLTGYTTVAVANSTASTSLIGVDTGANAETLIAGQPVTFDAAIGGLTADKVYFVASVANTDYFSVAAYQNGPVLSLVDDTATVNAVQDVVELSAASTATASGSYIYANDEAGYIVRQKGKQKYLVTGATTGLTAPCYTANVANTALTPNTMTMTGTYANAATVKVQSLSDHTAELFTATSGPIATGNIVLANADPAFVTFNSAAVANAANAMPYPLVQITSA